MHVPGRSRTDAADERRKALRQMTQLAAQQGGNYENYDSGTPSSVNYDMITLPKRPATKVRACKAHSLGNPEVLRALGA